jgi:hypothetical protein
MMKKVKPEGFFFIKGLQKAYHWLLNFSQHTQRNLVILISGFSVTLLGLLLVILAEFFFGQSIRQEILALIGVALIVIGLTAAAIGYFCLSVLSLVRYILYKPNKSKPTSTPQPPPSKKDSP